MILSVIYVYYPMPKTAMKWSSVNDVIVVYIKIVTGYRLYRLEHGFVDLVQLYDDQLVFFVQSKHFLTCTQRDWLICRLGGPLKCTASGTIWCHLTCALWIPELKVADYTKMVRTTKTFHLEKLSVLGTCFKS